MVLTSICGSKLSYDSSQKFIAFAKLVPGVNIVEHTTAFMYLGLFVLGFYIYISNLVGKNRELFFKLIIGEESSILCNHSEIRAHSG